MLCDKFGVACSVEAPNLSPCTLQGAVLCVSSNPRNESGVRGSWGGGHAGLLADLLMSPHPPHLGGWGLAYLPGEWGELSASRILFDSLRGLALGSID